VAGGTLRPLVGKELRSLLREPTVIAMILLPFIMYSGMAPLYGSMARQAAEAAKLQGVRVAIAACHPGPLERTVLELIAGQMKNATVVDSCDPLGLVREGYDVVMYFNFSSRPPKAVLYIRGRISSLMKTLALPSTLSGIIKEAGRERINVTTEAYIVLDGRVWSYQDLNSVFGAAMTLSYAMLFVLFPAASLGAALIGAEREERTLEVLFTLPVPRRNIAIAKAVAALVAAVLAAASALGGLYTMMRGISASVRVTAGGETAAQASAAPSLLHYYGAGGLAAYAAAVAAEALMAVSLAMLIGLFASTMRGAQSAAVIAVVPAMLPSLLVLTGLPQTSLLKLAPYTATLYAALSPLVGLEPALQSLAAQLLEALAALALLTKALESEVAITGPETLRRLRRRLGALRGRR